MKYNSENIDDLIAKVLAGEANREEIDALEGWLNDSQDNKLYYEDTKKLFSNIESFKVEHKVDSAKAWEKLNARIAERETDDDENETKVISLFSRANVLRAAASILLLAVLGGLMYRVMHDVPMQPVMLAATKTIVEQKLPDGSKVVMNKNSEITYVVNKENIREVKLKGEAFFEVVHNEEAPFEIVIEDIIIKDIGTAFNVKALPGSNTVEVLVESGEVQFFTSSNKGVSLVKGEKALYDKTTKQFTKSIPDPVENTISYKSKIFHFTESSLREVLNQVNDVYGSNIHLDNEKLGNCRLSVVFNNEDVDVLVSIIAETLDLEVERSRDTVILKGKPCVE
jgi:transmembrane sensor